MPRLPLCAAGRRRCLPLVARDPLDEAGVRHGHRLTLVLQVPVLAAAQKAFAQAGPDFLQAWGNPFWGGDLEKLPPRPFGYPILAVWRSPQGSPFTPNDPTRTLAFDLGF